MNKFVARKGLISLGDTILSNLSAEDTTIAGGLTADGLTEENSWNTNLNLAVLLNSAVDAGKYLLINVDGQQYTLPLYNFVGFGIGEMIIEDPRLPITFTVT